jgi:hypothetical protein
LRAITKQKRASQKNVDNLQILRSTQIELIEWFYHHRRERRREMGYLHVAKAYVQLGDRITALGTAPQSWRLAPNLPSVER